MRTTRRRTSPHFDATRSSSSSSIITPDGDNRIHTVIDGEEGGEFFLGVWGGERRGRGEGGLGGDVLSARPAPKMTDCRPAPSSLPVTLIRRHVRISTTRVYTYVCVPNVPRRSSSRSTVRSFPTFVHKDGTCIIQLRVVEKTHFKTPLEKCILPDRSFK